MNAFITQNAHLPIAGRYIDEHSVSELGFIHAQLSENNPGPVEGIASAMFLEVYADFTGALEFSLAYTLAQSVQVGL